MIKMGEDLIDLNGWKLTKKCNNALTKTNSTWDGMSRKYKFLDITSFLSMVYALVVGWILILGFFIPGPIENNLYRNVELFILFILIEIGSIFYGTLGQKKCHNAGEYILWNIPQYKKQESFLDG